MEIIFLIKISNLTLPLSDLEMRAKVCKKTGYVNLINLNFAVFKLNGTNASMNFQIKELSV